MMYDHVLRLIITLTSQYFRLISLPDASFGVIMATLTLLGLIVPKLAEFMTARFSPAQNCGWLALHTILTLLGLTWFIPYLGIIPIAMVMVGLMLTAFFTSHYLNEITPSEQRATVLSFKGLAFNLAYGIIGILFAQLIIHLRTDLTAAHPDWTSQLIENQAFKDSFLWMPGYFLVLIAVGWASQKALGRRTLRAWNRFANRVPVARRLYSASSHVFEAVLTQERKLFRHCALIEYPSPGSYTLVFETAEAAREAEQVIGEPSVSVFLPTVPNPASGFLLFLPRDRVHRLDMTVEEGFKMIFSAGMAVPESAKPEPLVEDR